METTKSQKDKIIINYFAPGMECLAPAQDWLTLDFTEKNQRARLNLKIGLESLHIRDKNFAGEINRNLNSNFDCEIGQNRNQNWLSNKTKLKIRFFCSQNMQPWSKLDWHVQCYHKDTEHLYHAFVFKTFYMTMLSLVMVFLVIFFIQFW